MERPGYVPYGLVPSLNVTKFNVLLYFYWLASISKAVLEYLVTFYTLKREVRYTSYSFLTVTWKSCVPF